MTTPALCGGVSSHLLMKTTFAERWREVVTEWKQRTLPDKKGDGYNELDRTIGAGQGLTSRIVNGKRAKTRLEDIEECAQVTGVRPAWLAFGIGPKTGGEDVELLADMSASMFVSQLTALPRLLADIRQHSDRWRLWQLARLIQDELNAPHVLDDAGNPAGGSWVTLLDEKIAKPAQKERLKKKAREQARPAPAERNGLERFRAIKKSQQEGSQPVPAQSRRKRPKVSKMTLARGFGR